MSKIPDRIKKAQKLEAIDMTEEMYELLSREDTTSRAVYTPTPNGHIFIFIVGDD